MNYPGALNDMRTITRYIERLKDEMKELEPNIGLVSSIARTTAHLAEAMMANQTLNPGD